MIINRGRGPEIAGTRVPVYDVMDFLSYADHSYTAAEIAADLWITEDQAKGAIDYIRSHQTELDREYRLIVDRLNRPNPPQVELCRAKTREELKQRLRARLEGKAARDHSVGS